MYKFLFAIFFFAFIKDVKGASITIVVMDAFSNEACANCKIKLSGKGTKNKILELNKYGERYFNYKRKLVVEPITNKKNYFGISKSYNSNYPVYRDTVWIYPDEKFENNFLKENKCPIERLKSDNDDKVPFDSIENSVNAEFIGDFSAFLDKHLYYPEIAIENGDDGRLIATFIVDTDGSLKCPMIIQSVSKEIDAEVLRIVRLMPYWVPASIDHVPVKMKIRLPIIFRY